MKAVLFSLSWLAFLGSTLVHAWDEDPRCQRRRTLKTIAANHGLSEMPFLDLGGTPEELEMTNGSAMNHTTSDGTNHLQGGLMVAPNNFRDINESDTSEELVKGSDSLLFPPHNTSGSLRGGTNITSHRRLEDFNFQVKMYWEEGFCWQEEWNERKWCWQCEGGNCNEGDKIQIRTCSGSSRQRFIYRPAGGGRVRISPLTRGDLCCEMVSDKRMQLAKCDSNDSDQEFSGFDGDGDEFELFPSGQSDRCLTQQHDPKSYEEVFAEDCRTARGDHTSEWVVYKPYGDSVNPNPSPTPQPQQAPTPSSGSNCVYDLNLRDNGFIEEGQRIRSPDDSDLYLELRDDGRLSVRDNGRTIWDNGVSSGDDDYWCQLQGDGNLITWRGRPTNRDDRVWKSNSSNRPGDYFLGLDCDKQYIGIYQGTPNNPGSRIWRERTGSSSPPSPTSPSPAPTPTGPWPSPGLEPRIDFRGSSYCTPNNKCGRCQGDCDDDDDCEGSLVCRQRDPGQSFSGCSGGGSDNSASDYCVES